MRCSECAHENTEGAWLCINCGTKLPRPDDQELESESHEVDAPREVSDRDESRFAPQISENLRKLRDRTERERGRQVTIPRIGTGTLSGTFLGLPLIVWVPIALVFIIFVYVVSGLQ